MFDHSDMFITLPGGFGTLDEIATFWIRCAYENKPIGILNVNNFYDKFIEYANHMVQEVRNGIKDSCTERFLGFSE